MGVDWIPCRVEPDVCPEDLDGLVSLDALRFRGRSGFFPEELKPLVTLSETELADIERRYTEAGPLSDRLLFKYDSHRVYVVTYDELFPLEWRVEAYRTIPPWELPAQVQAWQTYREEVVRGGHRAYLLEIFIYLRWCELNTFLRERLLEAARTALTRSDSWATTAETIAAREAILVTPPLPVPPPPVWQNLAEYSLRQQLETHPSFSLLCSWHRQVIALTRAWNGAVRRGNRILDEPAPLPDWEDWIARYLADEWFSSFLAWVAPWVRGNYGLYRDCG